jgi:L-2-hydroxyglutarate oxidase LhgO
MDYDVVIIGAGVVGLAIARELAESSDKTVLVIEKEANFGQGISSRNSEVIHSGIYYPPDSLKAKFCTRGRELTYDFCQKHQIWHEQCGKLVIAEENQLDDLEQLYNRSIENGVPDTRIIDQNELISLEPQIRGNTALFVGCTGIMSAHEFMAAMQQISAEKEHDYLFMSEVVGIDQITDGYKVDIRNPDGDIEHVTAEWVINAGGLHSDMIAEMLGEEESFPKLKYSKGCYFKLSSRWRGQFRHLVYPLPDEKHGSLGIHLSFDQTRTVKLGPSAHWLNNRVENYDVEEALLALFHAGAAQYIKGLRIENLTPDFAGIRPKIYNEKNPLSDFYISHEEDKGYPGWINLIGIESPGLTAALAIGEEVAGTVIGEL